MTFAFEFLKGSDCRHPTRGSVSCARMTRRVGDLALVLLRACLCHFHNAHEQRERAEERPTETRCRQQSADRARCVVRVRACRVPWWREVCGVGSKPKKKHTHAAPPRTGQRPGIRSSRGSSHTPASKIQMRPSSLGLCAIPRTITPAAITPAVENFAWLPVGLDSANSNVARSG